MFQAPHKKRGKGKRAGARGKDEEVAEEGKGEVGGWAGRLLQVRPAVAPPNGSCYPRQLIPTAVGCSSSGARLRPHVAAAGRTCSSEHLPGGACDLVRAISAGRILRNVDRRGPPADTLWGLQSGEPVLGDSRCHNGGLWRGYRDYTRG